MSRYDLVSPPKSPSLVYNWPLDPLSEFKFQQLKLETEEINKKMMEDPPLLNPTADSTTNEMLGMVLNELKEMRREIKEIKQDVSVMKTELEDQKEALEHIGVKQTEIKASVRNVQNDVTGIKKSLEEVQRNQQNQQQHLHERKVNVSSILNEIERKPESYSETDIRSQINGEWRNVNEHSSYFSLKFEDNAFMEKYHRSERYAKYPLGIKHPNGYTTSIEDNKIVQRTFTNQGEEDWRCEHYIENECLKMSNYFNGKKSGKSTYERIGDPYPE